MAALAPSGVHIKRRATDEAPDYLVLQGAQAAAQEVRYVRQRTKESDQIPEKLLPLTLDQEAEQRKRREARVYHLQAKPVKSVTGKRKGREDGPMFVEKEKEKRSKQHSVVDVEEKDRLEEAPPSRPLKRPGKGAAVRRTIPPEAKVESEVERRQIEQLAQYMHQSALEEVKRESTPKPKVVAQPKLSGARSREFHRQRVASNNKKDEDVDMESDDGDYVYDTYVLAPTPATASSRDAGIDVHPEEYNSIGYLIITEADQTLWDAYLEESLQENASDKDDNSDEEDENAEDYYGADYPEDEVDSEDEFGRNAYGFMGRGGGGGGGGADDEEWDEDTGKYSDDDDEVERRMMDPFKTSAARRQFAKYLEVGGEGGGIVIERNNA
ncbi:hypothetical protein LTR37_015060 [Vermiconidia calcicola]|uniref:Uncharacterized protein n=1 Tax=Vermiconidia calcicola TaxID=1690605 RepID=A0ACC3MTG9_9PEZI|nr:hypothetical protein LTR37_015060 [Vermiconidia calcicola]